jgi:hypothetical protein
MTVTKDPRLSAVCGYVNFDRYDDLERLADGSVQEITGTLWDGTGWTASRDQIAIGTHRYPAHIRRDYDNLRLYAGTREQQDKLLTRLRRAME